MAVKPSGGIQGSNWSMLPLRGKQDQQPWQNFGFYSEGKRRASSIQKKERKKRKKKKKDRCFETKAEGILYFIESLPGEWF